MKPKFLKHLEMIASRGHNLHSVFCAWVELTACVMAGPDMNLRFTAHAIQQGLTGWSRMARVANREDEYIAQAKRWKEKDLEQFGHALGAFLLESADDPYTDLLGPTHQDTLGTRGQQHGGEFHTPQVLCEAIARMAFSDLETRLRPDQPVTVLEPAGGAGAMLLAIMPVLINLNLPPTILQVTSWDISKTASDMCFINMTVAGIPAHIVHGDTLRMKQFNSWVNPWWPVAHGLKGIPGRVNVACETVSEPVQTLEPVRTPEVLFLEPESPSQAKKPVKKPVRTPDQKRTPRDQTQGVQDSLF
jgi:hypothetical protein